jgi:hypothetical protein
MLIAPLGDGRVELLVEVGLFVGRHGDYFAGRSKSITDSISPYSFRCHVWSPLTVEQTESRMPGRRRDGQILGVERLDKPILQSRSWRFPVRQVCI